MKTNQWVIEEFCNNQLHYGSTKLNQVILCTGLSNVIYDENIHNLFFGKLQHGKRSLGGQKKRFKDTLKVSLKAFGISHNSREQAAMERPKWWASIRSGAKSHKANRITAAEQRSQDRKSRASKPPTAATIHCPHCTRTFRTWIGLTSHLRTHRDRLSKPQDD